MNETSNQNRESSAPASEPAALRLGRLPIWSAIPVIEPIAGGRTNENFRVSDAGRSYFARLGLDLPHHGISRINEVRSHRLAAQAGIAPAVIHASDGVMVTEFIAGKTLVQGEPLDDALLVRLAHALQNLAEVAVPAELPIFDPAEICRRDLAALPAEALAAAHRDRAIAILAAAPALTTRALVHADLIPESVIVADARIMLVDWEYAGRGDPAVDVASVVLHFGLDPRQSEFFMACRGAVEPATVKALQPILALREVLWCEVQRRFAGVRGDLADYAEMCWQRLDRVAR